MSVILTLSWLFVLCAHSQPILKISSSTSTISLGGTIEVSVTYTNNTNAYTIWPFVNSSQWGSDQPLILPQSTTTLIIPFPHIGTATINVAILTQPYFNGIPWTVGQPFPSQNNIIALSNTLTITVKDNPKYYQNNSSQTVNNSMVIMYWEPWFTADNIGDWSVNEAIPLVGRYDSLNQNVMKQHILWFNDVGIDAIGIDWTNNIWNCDSWDQRGVYAQNLINATTATLQYYNYLKTHFNFKVPKFVLLLGLDNGPVASYNALNGEIQWVTDNYWLNKNISHLFIIYENKPLLTIFDGGNIHGKNGSLNASAEVYTYRWMASQFQSNKLNEKGFYSWMDGTVTPLPTYVNGSVTQVEALTITTAFFPASGGWFATAAYATNNGATLLQEGMSAMKYKPKFLFICQWNEFAGQKNGATSTVYVDIYNSTFGNDIEPTSLTQCGYKRPNNAYCGGWGFRQLNVLHAIIYLLDNNNGVKDSLFLIIGNPMPWKYYVQSDEMIKIEWIELGECGGNDQFDVMIELDKVNIANVTNAVQMYELNVKDVDIGTHVIQIIAPQCRSSLDLSSEYLSSVLSGHDMLVVNDTVQFTIH